MGYACPVIVVDPAVGLFSEDAHSFWEHFYSELLLEFCFVHKIAALPLLRTSRLEESVVNTSVSMFSLGTRREPFHAVGGGGHYNDSGGNHDIGSLSTVTQAILPLGGGKDSLVAWHLCKASGKNVQLLYVSDR